VASCLFRPSSFKQKPPRPSTLFLLSSSPMSFDPILATQANAPPFWGSNCLPALRPIVLDDAKSGDEQLVLERQYRYLTEAEFQQEAIEYTAEQLKEYGLYEKHINHFAKLRSRAMSHRALQLFAKVSISLLVLAIPIIVGFYLEERSLASRSDISMLPDLAHKDVPVRFEG